MSEIEVGTSAKYTVTVKNKLISGIGLQLKTLFPKAKVLIISDDNVFGIYGQTVKNDFIKEGFETYEYTFPAGEKSKNINIIASIAESLGTFKFNKSDILVALGGGVVGDITGFMASLYCRGIKFIQVPTTLLSAVDASVGGKNALNLKSGKNLIGTIYQPVAVYIDTDVIKALDKKIFNQGMAEVIKCAVIKGESFFSMLEKENTETDLEGIICETIRIKKDYVNDDEKDEGRRHILNLGHTIGHAVETLSKFSVSHGDAVAIGMTAIMKAAAQKGLCTKDVLNRLVTVLSKYKLQTRTSFSASDISAEIIHDKKIKNSVLDLIVPCGIGNCKIMKVKTEEIESWVKSGLSY